MEPDDIIQGEDPQWPIRTVPTTFNVQQFYHERPDPKRERYDGLMMIRRMGETIIESLTGGGEYAITISGPTLYKEDTTGIGGVLPPSELGPWKLVMTAVIDRR